ncbi:hypothetical protein BSZ19_35180 [Bradyrhizobium japonicum]|uniref:Uncharacterized protein n=1 Tax=Bradyrhizobium japonicum TaxID=375 RepID=A0A1Y2JFQ6_BRAJP|nr:hypothetical protein BSZ19_35180 [Bradyrhizobium japonicum]
MSAKGVALPRQWDAIAPLAFEQCKSAWGLNADSHANVLIQLTAEGSMLLEAYSQPSDKFDSIRPLCLSSAQKSGLNLLRMSGHL